ncbi:MAG: hypothetical protein IKU86_02810 [Thermoguttaceae bacterium]|nr:hypothetical protein [Thermoguttaceae bacterium]
MVIPFYCEDCPEEPEGFDQAESPPALPDAEKPTSYQQSVRVPSTAVKRRFILYLPSL